jgi:hypothetical protein
MENSLMTLLSVLVGGAVTFLASYILEARKLRNEKYQFKRDKIISVGEDFYRFSAYALLRFLTLLDNYKTLMDYDSQEARNILQQTDQNILQLLTKIGENNITITSADIFYGVSGVDQANDLLQTFKAAQARLEDLFAAGAPREEIMEALQTAQSILGSYIAIIKGDRLLIKNRIKEILNLNAKQSL